MPLGALLRIEAGNKPRDPGVGFPRNRFVRAEFHAPIAHPIGTPREVASLVEESAKPVACLPWSKELHSAPIRHATHRIEWNELEALPGDRNLEACRGHLKCLEDGSQAGVSRELPADLHERLGSILEDQHAAAASAREPRERGRSFRAKSGLAARRIM